MNHLYFEEEKVSAFAHALAKTPPFTKGPFLLYRDVPLKSLTCEAPCFRSARNLETMDDHTALQSVDFLICKGDNAVLGLTFDFDTRDSKQVFGTVLRGLKHIAVNSLDFKLNEYDTEGLLQQILTLLQELPPTEYILRVITAPAVRYLPELRHMRLVSRFGNATLYGKDCGLFFCCHADETGNVSEIPMFAGKGWQEYMRAINYSADGSFAALSQLMDSPIEALFEFQPDAWDELNQMKVQLARLDRLPADTALHTLSDYLAFLRRESHWEGAENAEVMRIHSKIRGCMLTATIPWTMYAMIGSAGVTTNRTS